MGATDRLLINRLQDGLPLTRAPFAPVVQEAGISEADVVDRISTLRETGTITRFGPLPDAGAMAGPSAFAQWRCRRTALIPS